MSCVWCRKECVNFASSIERAAACRLFAMRSSRRASRSVSSLSVSSRFFFFMHLVLFLVVFDFDVFGRSGVAFISVSSAAVHEWNLRIFSKDSWNTDGGNASWSARISLNENGLGRSFIGEGGGEVLEISVNAIGSNIKDGAAVDMVVMVEVLIVGVVE